MMIKANDINGQQTRLVEFGLRALTLKFKKWIEGPTQTGSQANGQSGKRANRQLFIITVAVTILVFLCSYPARGTVVNSTIRHCDDCLNSHFRGLTEPVLNATAAAADPAPQSDCPESVQSIRQIMALTYGTCEALEPFKWFTLRKKNGERLIQANHIFLEGYESVCEFNGGESCNYISSYDLLKNTHPYNQMEKNNQCVRNMKCGDRPCLTTFTLDDKPYAFHSISNNEIDIFKDSTMSHPHSSQRNTPNFLGWNCSEYITTAMALAGHRLVKPDVNNCGGRKGGNLGEHDQWFFANMYSDLAERDCSCLSKIDITGAGPDNSIKPGDIITLNTSQGHVMIVESVKEPFFREPSRKEDCNDENIRFDQLQIRVNHSSSTTEGPASIRFNEYLSLNHGQSITHGMGKYIDECVEAAGGDPNTPEAKNCWSEADQNELDEYLWYVKKIGLENVSDNSKWKVDKVDGEYRGEYIIDPMWLKMRKYLSSVCKRRWNQSHPGDQIGGDVREGSEFLKVIRHKGTSECTTPENQRPQLKHKECLGECINQEGNQCPAYE